MARQPSSYKPSVVHMTEDQTSRLDPYASLLELTSAGRVSLAWAMTHFCMLHWGADGREIVAALSDPEASESCAEAIRGATVTLGRVFAAGGARTYARPIGGGPSVPLDPEHWELDDWTARFRLSAIALKQPWAATAEPTYWIFVDAAEWGRIAMESCADVPGSRTLARGRSSPETVSGPNGNQLSAPEDQSLLRLPQVRQMTGLSRSTIYAKMRAGTFPRNVDVGSSMAGRRRRRVAAKSRLRRYLLWRVSSADRHSPNRATLRAAANTDGKAPNRP